MDLIIYQYTMKIQKEMTDRSDGDMDCLRSVQNQQDHLQGSISKRHMLSTHTVSKILQDGCKLSYIVGHNYNKWQHMQSVWALLCMHMQKVQRSRHERNAGTSSLSQFKGLAEVSELDINSLSNFANSVDVMYDVLFSSY